MPNSPIKFIFYGTSRFSVIVLDELKSAGFLPTLVVTVMDKPKGRKLVLTPPEAKVWAEENHIPYVQLKTLRTPETETEIRSYCPDGYDVGIVASYGKIIPQNILDIPSQGTINVHPSLLPKLRGPSPIQSAILTENETGVTIMHLDADMDHGPIILQEKVVIADWPPYAEDLEEMLAHVGGKMISAILPDWISGKASETEQDHNQATICKKIEKEDGQINLSDPADLNLRKIRAYHIWPRAYFWQEKDGKKIRVLVKRARIENGDLVIEKVVPEGKKEMEYSDFMRVYKK